MYYVLGIELNYAEVWGVHSHKKTAQEQAEYLEKTKNPLCCQKYEAITATEAKKRKYQLFM